MRYVFLWTFLFVVIIGCGTATVPTSSPAVMASGTPIEGLSNYELGDAVTVNNVTVVPVLQTKKDRLPTGDYISLSEAKKNGWIEITEMPEGQEVNRLWVHNFGPKPILLLAGELLLGGKQDRIVAQDTVVPSGPAMAVPVYCVEHDRWTGPTGKFEPAGTMAPQSVRDKANFGDQQQVWDEVSQYNSKAKVSSETSAVRSGMSSKENVQRVGDDFQKIVQGLRGQNSVVGLVFIVNGHIGNLELFGSPSLLEASKETLIKGVLADATVEANSGANEPSMPTVAQFVKESLLGERNQSAIGRSEAKWSVASKNVHGVETTLPTASVPAKGGTQTSEQLLHGSYSYSSD